MRPAACYRNLSRLTGRLCLTALFVISCFAGFSRPVIGFITDFGLKNEAVGLCKGAIAKVNPDLLVIDVTHDVEQYSIKHAALVLRRTMVFPKGTVFVCVVDPGVGTARRGIALETKAGFRFVGPDNGVFSLVAKEQGIVKAVELEPAKINKSWQPGTFDGRDLFSPAGALLASSGALESVGKEVNVESLVTQDFPTAQYDPKSRELKGEYLRTDEPYGNVWTNITADELTSAGISEGSRVAVSFAQYKLELPFAVSFGHVSEGESLAYLASDDTFALAINMGNFQEAYSVDESTTFTVRKIKE